MTGENTDSLSDSIADAIAAYHGIMSKNKRNMVEDMNRANRGELFVLLFLVQHNAPVLPSDLSLAMNSSAARISALLSSLERKGQIERNIDKSNRRYILVTITGSGRERAEAEKRKMDENLARVFIEMGEKDTAGFLRLTGLFFHLMQKYNTENPD